MSWSHFQSAEFISVIHLSGLGFCVIHMSATTIDLHDWKPFLQNNIDFKVTIWGAWLLFLKHHSLSTAVSDYGISNMQERATDISIGLLNQLQIMPYMGKHRCSYPGTMKEGVARDSQYVQVNVLCSLSSHFSGSRQSQCGLISSSLDDNGWPWQGVYLSHHIILTLKRHSEQGINVALIVS